jgi:hypothetical protein
MSTQPEALRIAESIECIIQPYPLEVKAAAELRRLHALNAQMLEALQEVFVIGDRLVADVYGREFVHTARAAIAAAREQTA